jgi:hypothetical protein
MSCSALTREGARIQKQLAAVHDSRNRPEPKNSMAVGMWAFGGEPLTAGFDP